MSEHQHCTARVMRDGAIGDDLMRRTTTGVGWTAGAKIIQQVVQFGLSAFLMRDLGPKAFGLIGMVLVFSGFGAILSEFGFTSAIVQRRDLEESHRSSAFWAALTTAAIATAILACLAPLVARFFREPQLEQLTRVIACVFVFAAIGTVPRALLQRRMEFDKLARVDLGAVLLSGLVAIVAAVRGAGVWSLVLQYLISAFVTSVLALFYAGWRPRLLVTRCAVRDVVQYGSGLAGFNIINYWARTADNLLIARVLGPIALALYSRAYALMLLPLTQVVSVTTPAMFPALSSIQDDPARIRRAYLRAMHLITFITFPLMLGLASVAQPFVLSIFGSQWSGVVPLIEILAFVGLVQPLCSPTGWIYSSLARTRRMFWVGIVNSTVLIVSIVIGVASGSARQVALAYLVGNLLIVYPTIEIAGRLIGMHAPAVFGAVWGNLLNAVTMAIAVKSAAVLLGGLPATPRLLILVALGTVVYGGMALLSRQPAAADFRAAWGFVRRTGRRRQSAAVAIG